MIWSFLNGLVIEPNSDISGSCEGCERAAPRYLSSNVKISTIVGMSAERVNDLLGSYDDLFGTANKIG